MGKLLFFDDASIRVLLSLLSVDTGACPLGAVIFPVLLAVEPDEQPDPATIGFLGADRMMLFPNFGSNLVQQLHGQQVFVVFDLNILAG